MSEEQRPAKDGSPELDRDAKFRELLERARSGSQEAWHSLYHRYAETVLRVIRRNFLPPHARLRREFDSDDLRQETWHSMFEKVCKGRSFASERQFFVYLLALCQSQFGAYRRKRVEAQKRTLTREEPLDEHRHGGRASGCDPAAEAELAEEFRLAGGGENRAGMKSEANVSSRRSQGSTLAL